MMKRLRDWIWLLSIAPERRRMRERSREHYMQVAWDVTDLLTERMRPAGPRFWQAQQYRDLAERVRHMHLDELGALLEAEAELSPGLGGNPPPGA